MAVAARIKYFRHIRAYSQEELALKANLNPAYYGQVERGLKCPTVDTLYKIAKALDIEPAEFLRTQQLSDPSSYNQRVCELLSRVPQEKQNQVVQILEDVVRLF